MKEYHPNLILGNAFPISCISFTTRSAGLVHSARLVVFIQSHGASVLGGMLFGPSIISAQYARIEALLKRVGISKPAKGGRAQAYNDLFNIDMFFSIQICQKIGFPHRHQC